MDIEKFKAQMRILRKLKRTKHIILRRLHRREFSGTPFYMKLPGWAAKDTVIRRLYYLYCYKNYHYPDDHPITIHFRKKAEKFLDPANFVERHKEEESRQQLEDLERFSKRNILAMDINNIDRYLAGLNLHLDAPESQRRRVLWEYFNLPQSERIKTNNEKGNKVRRKRRGRINNKYVLRDLILANPEMTWMEFYTTFHRVMPTVSHSSFNTSRSLLRKAGYNIPRLKTGPAHPVVSGETARDEDGILTRARSGEETEPE